MFGELRPSQIVTSFGPGAVIDQPTASLILSGTDDWAVSDEQRIDEPRLTSMLHVSRLYRPRGRADSSPYGIPARVFPRYLVCPRCQRIAPFDRFHFDGRVFRCPNRREHPERRGREPDPRAYPARFVVACAAGHLDDFPWFSYAHRGRARVRCDPLRLTFYELSESGSISDLWVRCTECGAGHSMEAAFGERASSALGPCSGHRPWLSQDQQGCDQRARATLRGASNLYFPIVQSTLSIPEWDDPIHEALAHHEDDLSKVDSLERLESGIKGGFLSKLERFPAAQAWDRLEARRRVRENPPTPMDVRHEEFMALRTPTDPAVAVARQFQTSRTDTPQQFADLIDHLVIVRRLREVRALDAFTRIDAPPDLLLDDDEAAQSVQHQPLGTTRSWRPAVELLGEGIFLTLNEDAVRRWQSSDSVVDRARALARADRRWRAARRLPPVAFPGARFVLLHSLAHLLITALSLECGYSATSIRERIYSSDSETRPMAGVLLYTATPDSDGSLGGLADQGETARFEHLLTYGLQRASFCSSDPLCGHAAPGETGGTNGAACHACLLVSEPSCERSNRFLDRAHIVSTVGQLGIEFFGLSR